MIPKTKIQARHRRHLRLRQHISGTAVRPRMAVSLTGKHIYVQFIDDVAGKTIAAMSTVGKGESKAASANVAGAKQVGSLAAKAALDKGITTVVFDRGGTRYHGKIKALADAAREAGLKF